MSETDKNKIDMELLEQKVAEATESKAVGRFVVKAVKAAMELRAGLSREQTPICDAILSTGRQANVRKTAVWLAQRTLTTLLVCFLTSMSWKSSRRYRLSAKKD